MLQHIEESCTLGAHAAVIVPPTWIIRVRKQQVQAQPSPLGLIVLPCFVFRIFFFPLNIAVFIFSHSTKRDKH